MSGFTPLQAPWLQGGGNSLGSNPITLMGEVMKLRQGQQEWNARQQLGNIFAGSPDMDTALERARQDPLVSQFPQFMTELRNQRLLDTQTQQAQLGQANSAREAVQHSVLEAGNDPDALLPAMQRQISSLNYLPKNVQQQMLAHAQTIAENLTHGQDKMSPEERSADYVKKRAQFLVSQGMKPEEAYAAGGGAFLNPQVTTVKEPGGGESTRIVGGPLGMGQVGGGGGIVLGKGPAMQPSVQEVTTPTGATQKVVVGGDQSLGQVTPLSTGPSTQQKEYLTSRGKDMAQYQTNLDDSVKTGSTIMQTVEQARDALTQFKAGAGASAYAAVAQVFQALGASQELVDKIANGNLGATQEMQKLMVNTTMNQVREQIPKGSRLSQMEFAAFNRNNPNIDTDPRATEKIFNFWTRLYSRDRIEQREMNSYLEGGGDISKWPQVWQEMGAKMGIFNPQFTNTTGAAVSPASVKHLLDNPDTAEQFNQRYGPGAAEKYLGAGKK